MSENTNGKRPLVEMAIVLEGAYVTAYVTRLGDAVGPPGLTRKAATIDADLLAGGGPPVGAAFEALLEAIGDALTATLEQLEREAVEKRRGAH